MQRRYGMEKKDMRDVTSNCQDEETEETPVPLYRQRSDGSRYRTLGVVTGMSFRTEGGNWEIESYSRHSVDPLLPNVTLRQFESNKKTACSTPFIHLPSCLSQRPKVNRIVNKGRPTGNKYDREVRSLRRLSLVRM